MFKFTRKLNSKTAARLRAAVAVPFEKLEDRRLLSASGFGGGHHGHGGGGGGHNGGSADTTITFNLAPTAVQTGLDALATADGVADPTSTSTVHLGNSNGIETYSVTINGTGTVSTLTVDQLGDAVTAPTTQISTFATLSSDSSAAAAEVTAIASALDLNAPTSDDIVIITTSSTGAVTYEIQLQSSTTSTTTESGIDPGFDGGTSISVDSSGNPVGNQKLPFSVIPTAIQTAINNNAPTGTTALVTTSTQNVDVKTTDGITTYSTTFTTTGTKTTVTVNAAGTLTSLPATTTTTFSTLSSALQTELQTLATADGVSTAIASTQSVTQLTETNGTIIYSISLAKSGTGDSGSTYSFDVTIAVDSNGNPTTLPNNGFGFGDQGFGDGGFGDGGMQGGCGVDGGTGTNGSSGTTSNSSGGATVNASSGAIAISGGDSAVAANVVASSSSSLGSLSSKLLGSLTKDLGALSGYITQFAPTLVNLTTIADVAAVVADNSTLVSDTKALTKSQKATLTADEKAITSAIKATSSTTAPLVKTLKSDAKTYAALLKADQKTINKDKKNPTALATAKAKLASDESTAFSTVVKDGLAIETAITSNGGVIAANAKLSSDLPTIASDQSAVVTDATKLVNDIKSELAAG